MGPSAFLSGEGAGDDGLRDIEKGLEFENLQEIRIKHAPFILYRDEVSATNQLCKCRECGGHGFVSPNEAKIETHQLAEFFPNLPSSDRSLLCQQTLDAALFDGELICCRGLVCTDSSVFSGSNSGAPAKHNRLQE